MNEFEPKDFTSIDFLPRAEATESFGPEGKGGAVLITPFVDEALTMHYYEGINNKLVQGLIVEYSQKGLIKQNPVLVVNGVPLRGEEITETINRIGEEGIREVNLLKKKSAYEIYGIRAINGVLVIDTKL